MRESIKTTNAPQAIGPYSQAIKSPASATVFTAGQLGIDPQSGNLVEGGIAAQTSQALKNIRSILQAAGASMDDIVKTTVFMQDLKDFGPMNEVYAEFFHSLPPARSTVEVARLPKNGLVEIEAIAVVA
jgi:2-iminobutanoate/2-iminopropanoate deaminase